FRAWGIQRLVRDASPIPREFGNAGVVAFGTLLGDYRYDWFARGAVNQYYFAENERLPQYELERIMRARAAEFDAITLDFGCTATGVAQDDDGVAVTVRDAAGAERTLRGAYAAGCDGARSMVRDAAGIEQDVDPHDRRMCLLVFKSAALNALLEPLGGKTIFNVLNPDLEGYWQFLGRVDVDGTFFYHAPVPAETTAENFDFAAYLHDAIGADFAIDFQHIGFWDLRISVAKDYRKGRVFIAGDAAHSHPPYGGYGVNNGLEDARNLSWKLAAALTDWAGPALLESYSQERQPVFQSTSQDFIGRMIRDDRDFGARFSPEKDKAAFEAAWAERAGGGNKEVTQYLPNYAGSPIVWGVPSAQSNARGQHSFRAEAGHHLAPQPLASGAELFDLLGRGFALLAFDADPTVVAAFEAAAEARGVPFTVIADTSAEARAAYGARCVLVRPDLFVAWAGDAPDPDTAAILARAVGG
ncbi:MAG: FAD-dependent monooxygenase, partial [Rhodospirillaceae bacterium]